MNFEDDAIVLSAKPYAETGAIVHVLTSEHGHMAAHIAGGASRRMKPILQMGSRVLFKYKARTSEQLGSATIEALDGDQQDLLEHPMALLGLQCACLITQDSLSEREPQASVFHAFTTLMGIMPFDDIWPAIYVRFEAGLLEAMGFGLSLSSCAVTGDVDDLIYVSPRSGRAVSRRAGEAFKDKLLKLPRFLLSSQGGIENHDIANGIALTGYFLERHVYNPQNKPLPEVRSRLLQAMSGASKNE